MKIQITFKSGAQVTADVNTFTTTRRGSKVKSMTWQDVRGSNAVLHHVNLREIVAIVALGGVQ